LDFRFAEYEIDIGQHELRRSGKPVPIEPQVFDLLVHLVRNHERTVTKDELFERIWHGRIVSEAALSSRIKAARKAVGDNGDDQNLIRTIHKRGFRFVGEVETVVPSAAVSIAPATPALGAADTDAGAATALLQRVEPVAAPADEPAAPVSGRPSIAVFPFKNLSDDPEYEYFSYGMMEDVIRLLSRNRWLTVISRHSTTTVVEPDLHVREASDALHARYLLTGSIRRGNESVRIRVELVRGADGSQLWGESYDVPLADVFDIQEEMARQISATIEPELHTIERQLASRKPPNNLDAWECYQRALWHLCGFTRSGFDAAEQFLLRAIELDPELARAHATLGYVNVQRALYATPADRPAHLEAGLRLARSALALDDRDCMCHFVHGRALCLLRRNDEATAALDLAMELNPSFAQAYFAQGFNALWSGRPLEAEALLDRAIMLSPRDGHVWSFHHVRAWARFSLGELEAAARFARQATLQPNVTYRAFATLTASLGLLGNLAEAQRVAVDLLERKPEYSGDFARQEFFFCGDDDFIERFVGGLRAAGIPHSEPREPAGDKSTTDAERAHVTVLSAEIVSPLQAFADFDPELVSRQIDPLFETALSIIERNGGVVSAAGDGGITAFFGATPAEVPHAVAACLAALSINAAVEQQSEGSVRLRAGLDTGDVMIQRRRRGTTERVEVTGAATRSAARLAQSLRRGAVAATDRTRIAVDGAIDMVPLSASDLAGSSRDGHAYEICGAGAAVAPVT
jgi:TolB-like protein/DNA-binding winged helix-turn-helix (wHTH) protein/class 3 adenylate cyclase